jgi:hypothetical protein
MEQYGTGDGLPPWAYPSSYGHDNTPHSLNHKISSVSAVSAMSDRPALSHKFSSISAISTMSSGDGSSGRASVVSSPSPEPGYSNTSNEQNDMSHVRLSDGDSAMRRPLSTSTTNLPDILRAGSPASPTSRGFLSFRSPKSSPSYSPV